MKDMKPYPAMVKSVQSLAEAVADMFGLPQPPPKPMVHRVSRQIGYWLGTAWRHTFGAVWDGFLEGWER